jgi:hypothetical protein
VAFLAITFLRETLLLDNHYLKMIFMMVMIFMILVHHNHHTNLVYSVVKNHKGHKFTAVPHNNTNLVALQIQKYKGYFLPKLSPARLKKQMTFCNFVLKFILSSCQ